MLTMFVVDFISASILAVVLTVGFAAVVRAFGYRRVRDVSAGGWTIAAASWIGGILLVAFGPALTGTHWLPFLFSALLTGLLVICLQWMPTFRRSLQTETGEPGADARPLIAMYFIVTLLLYFCAVSFRFYVVELT